MNEIPQPRILIVEDEEIVAADLSSQLQRLNYQPLGPATTGAQALALAEELRPDLVLMDILLKGPMDGITAAQEIRARCHIPAVFITANAESPTLERAKLAEPFGYLLKPFESRTLRATIEMAISKHRSEATLRASEERYRLLVEDSPDAIGIFQEEKIVFINAAGAKLLGVPAPAELLGRQIEDFILPEDYAAAMSRLRRRLAGESGLHPAEVRCRRQDATLRPVELSAAPITFAGQPAVQFIARDLTERKRLEELAWQAQKMQAIGHLAGGVAHEFNNILATVVMSLDLLKLQTADPDSCGLLDGIGTASRRATTLVRQLLAFSRQSLIQRQHLDLAAVVIGKRQMLNQLLGEHIRLEFRGRSASCWVNADPGSLEQVLLNLCLNARDAMPDGGVLSIELAGVVVSAEVAATHPEVHPGDFVCWSITDTGSGIRPEIMPLVFDPFFTTKDVGQGTGLGLATVRGLIEQQHGWVEVESRVGHGSTFRVFLPAVAPPPEPATGPRAELVRGEGTILLVEDEPVLRSVGEQMLSRIGYTVLTAADGVEALAVWAEHRAQIDLLYTDVVMPGEFDGIQLAQRILADKPGLKVILTSVYSLEVLGLGEDLANAIIYLPKPSPLATLTQVIKDCLSPA